jgi:hypothetical protein
MVILRKMAYIGITLGVLLVVGCSDNSGSFDSSDGTEDNSKKVNGLKAPNKVSAVEAK